MRQLVRGAGAEGVSAGHGHGRGNLHKVVQRHGQCLGPGLAMLRGIHPGVPEEELPIRMST